MRKITFALQGFMVICAICLGLFYLVASAHLFPVLGVDSAPHLIPILNLKARHGLTGVAWPLTRDYDPTGQHRFLQYPPLFHLAVARLILHSTVEDVFICLACFAMAALALYSGLVWQRSPADASACKLAWLALACLSLFSVSTWLYTLSSSGRPEALATPVILLATLCVLAARPPFRAIVAGAFIGVLGGIQIATACLGGLLFSVYVALQLSKESNRVSGWISEVVVAGVLSLLVFSSSMLLSPFGFMETMRGIVAHLRQIPSGEFSLASYYLFPANGDTFYGLFFLVLLVHFLWWHRTQIDGLVAGNIGALLVAVWVFAIRHPNRSYNLLAFSPVLIVLSLQLLSNLEREATQLPWRRYREAVYVLYLGLFSLMSIGFVRQVLLFETFEEHGVTYQAARERLRILLPSGDDTPVMFDSGIWALLDHFDKAYFNTSENLAALDHIPGSEKPVLIVDQWYGRWATPPTVPGYRLVWDDFIPHQTPRVLGIKIGTAMPGYAFAFYKPIGTPRLSSSGLPP